MKKKSPKISLGVNIDHAATLRQVRGNTTVYPDLIKLTQLVKKAGGEQITIHLREDRRHIQDQDVVSLCRKSKLPINLEMAVSEEMLTIAIKNRPSWVCFVPEKREELTTEGGLNIVKVSERIEQMTAKLRQKNIQVSFFIEASIEQVEASAWAGAQAVEFHTGHWVNSRGSEKKKIWAQLQSAARRASALGLRVHAGHGLDYEHCRLIKKMHNLVEVNVGHSLICYSLETGIEKAIRQMRIALK